MGNAASISTISGGIYLSYIPDNDINGNRAVLLFSELRAKNIPFAKTSYQTTWDEETMTEMRNGVSKAYAVVVCVTQQTLSNTNQCLEMALANAYNKPIHFVAMEPVVQKQPFLCQLQIDSASWHLIHSLDDVHQVRDELNELFEPIPRTTIDNTNPNHTFPNGDKYWGLLQDGKKHGYGRCVYANPAGREYVGEFKDNYRNGPSVVRYPNGNVFVGTYEIEKWHGKGLIIYNDGDKYEGDYQKGVRCGKGKMWLNAGDVYEGEFNNDEFNGNGKYTWVDGAYYEGGFKDGLHHGQGIMNEKDGDVVHSGNWVDGDEA